MVKATTNLCNGWVCATRNAQVPEHAFPMDADLGIWSWRYDEEQEKGIVRIYQRVSKDYPWLCTYFGADVGQGVKANQACECCGLNWLCQGNVAFLCFANVGATPLCTA